MRELEPAAVRLWCETLARGLEVQRIDVRDAPYLERYFVAGWRPGVRAQGGALFLHHFVASDPVDAMHSHPWAWGASLIMVGGYREYRCDRYRTLTVRDYAPGDVNRIGPEDTHRVELLAGDCWTLFAAGPWVQPWAFSAPCGGT